MFEKTLIFVIMSILFFGCKKDVSAPMQEEVEVATTVASNCRSTKELEMNTILAGLVIDVPFTYAVERADGRRYVFDRGVSSLQTSYESASTSKLVTAVIILRLVEQGYLALTDRPQDKISGWPINSSHALSSVTLTHLLSFTSGMTNESLCLNSGAFDFETCVKNIATQNLSNNKIPGTEFYYSENHLQVAGLMAVKSRGISWQNIFLEFKSQTGLFSSVNSLYDLPSLTNPRLASGMHWKGEEYLAFLKALRSGTLLNNETMTKMLADQTSNLLIGNSPAVSSILEDWHYGFGLWHECTSTVYNCIPGTRVSSPGSYGAYPFWDRSKNYIGIVARQGAIGTFPNGLNVEKSVRSKTEEWINCN